MSKIKEAMLVRTSLRGTIPHMPDGAQLEIRVLGMTHKFVIQDQRLEHVESHDQDNVVHLMDGAMDETGIVHSRSGA